jgi:predicted amidohydrolase
MQARPVGEVAAAALDAALDEVAAAARRAGVVTLVGVERPTPRGREIVHVVLDERGARLGEQVKTQMHPDEERLYVVGAGRRVFTAGGATFGIAICHEVYRYPETVRGLARAGAQIVFAPYFVNTSNGALATSFADPRGSYHEKALLCRAVENTIYVAAANPAMPDQGAATCVLDPAGALVAQVPYGAVGVATADVELDRATRMFADRWAPERNVTG